MIVPSVEVEVRSSGHDGPWSAQWGWRRVRLLSDVVREWCDKVQKGNTDGVAIIIRREP